MIQLLQDEEKEEGEEDEEKEAGKQDEEEIEWRQNWKMLIYARLKSFLRSKS